MKPLNFQIFIHLLLFTALAAGAACNPANGAGDRNITAASSETNAPQTSSADVQGAATQTQESNTLETEGTYLLNNHRKDEEGYENTLTIENPENGKMRVSFEGTFFFQANGAESFHESSAYGTLTVNGNIAKGALTEEGSDNLCRIELNFSDARVNLKSTDCDLRVTPDGVYKKGAEDKSKNLDADVVEQDRSDDSPAERPYVQYGPGGKPDSIVNLMEHEGERNGCGEEIVSYVGQVAKVDYLGDYVYEFLLTSDNRKPQKIALILMVEDRLPLDDVRAIIKKGNHLEVRFINCGNAPIASPTEIYKR